MASQQRCHCHFLVANVGSSYFSMHRGGLVQLRSARLEFCDFRGETQAMFGVRALQEGMYVDTQVTSLVRARVVVGELFLRWSNSALACQGTRHHVLWHCNCDVSVLPLIFHVR